MGDENDKKYTNSCVMHQALRIGGAEGVGENVETFNPSDNFHEKTAEQAKFQSHRADEIPRSGWKHTVTLLCINKVPHAQLCSLLCATITTTGIDKLIHDQLDVASDKIRNALAQQFIVRKWSTEWEKGKVWGSLRVGIR